MNKVLTMAMAGALLLLPCATVHATECVAIPPKPVHRIWGVVINQVGDLLDGATVTILKGNEEVTSARTGNDGRFAFDQLTAGTYNVRVEATGYLAAFSPVTLVNPTATRKKGLSVMLAVGGGCSSMSVERLKKPKS